MVFKRIRARTQSIIAPLFILVLLVISLSNLEMGYASTLTVVTPNGGQKWAQGTAHTISWTSSGSPGSYVKIELLKGSTVNLVISSSTANDGSYSWTIPAAQTVGTDYKIRITSTTDPTITDSSDSSFSIAIGVLTVMTPNGGQKWAQGTTHSITWQSSGSPGAYLKIELLKAGVVSLVISSSTANDGSYSWTIPSAQTLGTDYKIRITSTTYASVTDSSDSSFTIAIGVLTVTAPNGGQKWVPGTTHTITWTSSGSPGSYVKIELLKGSTVSLVISSSTANDGSYSWTIPAAQTLGVDYKIRITSTTYASITDSSDSTFSVVTGVLTLTSPIGDEGWARGTTHTISWISSGTPGPYLKIELLKAGVVNLVIATSTANDGFYSWTIPAAQTLGTDYKVRITSTADATITNTGGNFAIIIGTLTVTSPNGDENWIRGTTHTITWTSIGSPGANVKIELLKADAVTLVISSSTANDGSYSWTIPAAQTLGVDYKIRITSTTNTGISDTSNSIFAIVTGTLTVMSPNGAESWVKGTTHTITWTSSGSPGSYVKLELLKAGLAVLVISSSTANDGSYSWTIPAAQTTGINYEIRITSTTYSYVTDSSNSYFSITT